MTRMFKFITKTWNPIVGCYHNCYGKCWAMIMAKRRKNQCKLCYQFKPHLHPERLKPFKPRKPTLIFTVSMGDLFGQWVPSDWIHAVLDVMNKSNKKVTFFLETKNPRGYIDYTKYFPEKIILSTTIETNRNYKVSHAPPTIERYSIMKKFFRNFKKHISIEPILDFDHDELVKWICHINPENSFYDISIGYDNYNNKLPEPSLKKTLKLKTTLESLGFKVEIKSLRKAWWEK